MGRQLAQQGRQDLGRQGQGLLDGDSDQLPIVARRPPGKRASGTEQGQQLQVAIADYRAGFGVSWARRRFYWQRGLPWIPWTGRR